MLHENWEARELWQTHKNNQHSQGYMAAIKNAVEQFTLYKMAHIA